MNIETRIKETIKDSTRFILLFIYPCLFGMTGLLLAVTIYDQTTLQLISSASIMVLCVVGCFVTNDRLLKIGC
jgi:hypothetical protein